MKKFEYKSLIIRCKRPPILVGYLVSVGNFNETEFLTIIHEQGNEGWELIQVLPYLNFPSENKRSFWGITFMTMSVDARLVFKREIVL